MHVHILGICGTFMGSLALLARDLGHKVTGSDANVYPPMSTQLEEAGVTIMEGYAASHLQPAPDLVIVGNAMKRGIEAIEYMLDMGLPYTSGPQFLAEHVLHHRHVIAVAGTHGKTTTTTMLAWILHYAGIDTGFLIGGVPLIDSQDERLNQVFAHSSYLGSGATRNDLTDKNNEYHAIAAKNNSNKNDSTEDTKNTEPNRIDDSERDDGEIGYFVIEADEYDSAFFDKRSKFVHYRPRTAILNNLEYDHADIFADLGAIQTQFHHMIRMIPSNGQIIMPANTPNLEETIRMGCWTPILRTYINEDTNDDINEKINNDTMVMDTKASLTWLEANVFATLISKDGSHFSVKFDTIEDGGESVKGEVKWTMSGEHNVNNALVAITAAHHVGVSAEKACEALSNFAGIKRRMELIADIRISNPLNKADKTSQVLVFDDFAHHPTAIQTTLDGAIKKHSGKRIWAIIEPRSNTMKLGIHKDSLAKSAQLADNVIWYEPSGLEWGLKEVIAQSDTANRQMVMNDVNAIIDHVVAHVGIDTNIEGKGEEVKQLSQMQKESNQNKQSEGDIIIIMSNGSFENIHSRMIDKLNKFSVAIS